jgi:dCMP deaminase
MDLADLAATRSNCSRRHFGAILVRDRSIVSTGYNGTPTGVKNCIDGGCPRCSSNIPLGEGYDICICVHAEINAVLTAARLGIDTSGTILYTQIRPCLSCLKELIQAGVTKVISREGICYTNTLHEEAYEQLASKIQLVVWGRKELTRSQTTT